MKKFLRGISLLLLLAKQPGVLCSQSVCAPLNNDYYQLVERYEILSGKFGKNLFSSYKPWRRSDIAALADSAAFDVKNISKVDQQNLCYLRDDNWEWSHSADSGSSSKPLLKYFYRKKNALYAVDEKSFNLQLNPVAMFSYGNDGYNGLSKNPYLNTRGFELRGVVDGKLGFYAFLTDNQAVFPEYVSRKIDSQLVVPGEGFWTTFKKTGYDFYTARGYINFNFTKHINTQFGHDKNFIGNGYRSILLSDYSSNYLYWKTDLRFRRFQYTVLFTQMVANTLGHRADAPYPRKHMALHYLTVNVTKFLNIGLFESITFGNTDSIHDRGFDPNYLNPIIFYKAIENGLGSLDKAHIGADFKCNFARRFSAYGAVFIDEFLLSEVRAARGWWGNKQAVQLGMKYINAFGLKNLDLQIEYNAVRPYTYSHFSFSKANNYSWYSNYSNYEQALAHPLGANFTEVAGIVRYQPIQRITLTGKIFSAQMGLDTSGKNYGGNFMLPYQSRVQDYGNVTGQGGKTTLQFISFSATCELYHNLFIDLNLISRQQLSRAVQFKSNETYFSMSLRWNIPKRLLEF